MKRIKRKPYTILTGDVRKMLATLPSESAHCCVTSPPYWGLRDYGTPPQVWGEKDECDHEWGPLGPARHPGQVEQTKWKNAEAAGKGQNAGSGQFCHKCRAWLGSLGLEPTPELYVEHIVAIFREVRRVLRRDGTLWLNMGDCYTGGYQGRNDTTAKYKSNILRRGAQPGIEKVSKPRPVPKGMKPKDLVGVPWRVAFALQADGWWLRSDIIWAKCLSGGTRLYARTQKGEMPSTLKDLVRLRPETVQLWNGQNWTRVVSWNRVRRPQHPIEIVLRSGERVGCTSKHRWPTMHGIVRADDLRIGDILISSRLPKPEAPVSPSALHAQEIGWFVGIYIAEGSRGKNGTVLQFAGHEKESKRFARLRRIAAAYGGTARVHHTGWHAVTCNIYGPVLCGILRQYVSGRTAKDKHLHPRCWARSNKFLHALLQGYLEGDGHHRQNEWRLGFTQNDALAADLRVVCARLGLSVRLKRTVHRIGIAVYPGWRGSIRETKHRRTNDNEVVSIGLSRARQFWDVQVSDQPHTFALASGVLTHNSNPMPESCRDRPTKAHEYVFMLTKNERYFFDQEAVRESQGKWDIAKNSTYGNERVEGIILGRKTEPHSGLKEVKRNPAGRNIRSVWTIPTQPFPEAHFATFPEALAEICIKAGTSERGCCPACGAPWARVVEKQRTVDGEEAHLPPMMSSSIVAPSAAQGIGHGRIATTSVTVAWRQSCTCPAAPPAPCTVLDPFVGSGTTAIVAVRLGRRAVGIDLSDEYTSMVRKQLAVVAPGAGRRPRKFRLKRRKRLKHRRPDATG